VPPKRGDGKLYITFISMGQGDCTIVSLPNGKTMMIDCGTSRWDTDFNTGVNRNQTKDEQTQQIAQLRQGVINVIYEPRFLDGYDTLDALVLTHPDKDHCNELASILKPGIAIKSLYHSTNIGKYTHGAADWWLHHKANVTNEYAVIVNQNAKTINGVDIPEVRDDDNNTINRRSKDAATKGFVKILEGTKGAGKPCHVYILASNVQKYDNVNDQDTRVFNRGSVVTLIVYGSQKFMICGDATTNTEKFILAQYNADVNRIVNLEVVQVGHHGSQTSSSHSTSNDPEISAISFVDKVNPRIAIISAATDSGGSLKLPRYETIEKYLTCARLNALNHNISCWWYVPPTYGVVNSKRTKLTDGYPELGQKNINKHIISTGDEGAIDIVREDANV